MVMEGDVVRLGVGGDAVEEAIENHPAGKGVTPEQRALLEAAKWSNRVTIARRAYADALDRCRELGIPNTVIAHAVGKTEAAVRMHILRRGQRK